MEERTIWICKTMLKLKRFVPSEGSDKVYEVTHGTSHHYDDVILDYACTCGDYEYNRKPHKYESRPHANGDNPRYCKHINLILAVGDGICKWQGDQTELINDKCPQCGSPTHPLRWAINMEDT